MQEIKAYTVAVGNVNPLSKASREAVKIIKTLNGLLGVKPCYPHGTLLLFKTKSKAIAGRNILNSHGIQTSDNICECFIPKETLV